ncbi:hypothetical protein AU476_10680 [Cupriavidus sp. UYMSc13B]|nr:hypothetical protein AU476_10680 [Cupriavidus sp. UYMSc13B]
MAYARYLAMGAWTGEARSAGLPVRGRHDAVGGAVERDRWNRDGRQGGKALLGGLVQWVGQSNCQVGEMFFHRMPAMSWRLAWSPARPCSVWK